MTYWAKCTFDRAVEPPWELAEYPDRGYCAYSNRNFKEGDLVLSEMPTITVQGHHPFTSKQIDEIEQSLKTLSEQERNSFYDMANVFIDAPTISAGIFMTNSFDMTDSPQGESCGMYLAIARLNHSCSPNVQQTHIPHSSKEVLYACRTIAVGDEINDSYIDLRQDYNTRQRILQENYRFQCTCIACSLPVEQRIYDDKQRTQALTLESELLQLAENQKTDDALGKAIELVTLLTNSNNTNWSIRYISSALMYLYHIALSLDMTDYAHQCLSKAHRLNLSLTGPESQDSMRTQALLDGLSS